MASLFKKKVIRPVRDFILFKCIQALFFLAKLIPRKLLLTWHGFLSSLAFYLLKKTRKNTKKHLQLVFQDKKSKEEINQMAKEVFRNLSLSFTDYIIFSTLKTREEFSKYFKIEGEEHLKEAYEKGKGVLCLIPHTSAWEFSAIMPAILGYETSAVSREIKNPALNKSVIQLRESRGMKNISRNKCYDKLIEVLNKGECLIIMIDQDSKKVRGEFLQFFGKQAYTPLGSARLALETGASLVPMATYRNKDNTYTFKIHEALDFIETGDREKDLILNTQKHNEEIEKMILAQPTQWVWMHKRWDTNPENLKEYWEKRKKKTLD